jgi:uncharacterized alkaline shock family protein YloU
MPDLDETLQANGGGGESAGAGAAAGAAAGLATATEAAAATGAAAAALATPSGPAGGGGSAAVVKGRITIEDEVAEKVAALAALEVDGVADLGGDIERTIESVRSRIGVGQRRGNQGVRAKVTDRQVAIDVIIVVEYGRIALEVANAVKANVARAANHMLGMRVTEVNVTVDDVRLPGEEPPTPEEPADDVKE